ncbi:hypothetical protein [Azospirillum soli]|uniref:hypothetical protein n=1 Tax=Azospirillum soli TaxID=1304799 RepID=UPI001AE65B9D|nr:hypothetical protein [Azospirillum soli]MBP2316430.1 TolB-like protein [Azospirillum soli]
MADGTPPIPSWTLDERAIRAQLDRILANDQFDASERNRRFLRYVVEESLAGRTQQIKAYCIAVSVFNRDASFDPQSDPIVRLEAGRLRRSLEHYYLTAGRDDPIRIAIPKGGYAPTFEATAVPVPIEGAPAAPLIARRAFHKRPVLAAGIALLLAFGAAGLLSASGKPPDPAPEEALALALPPRHTGILVVPFRALGEVPDAEAMAAVLTDELLRGLSNRAGLAVHLDLPRTTTASTPELRLTGSLLVWEDKARVLVHLTDQSSGAVLWTERFDRPLPRSERLEAPQELAAGIVAPFADPQGPLFEAVSSRHAAR